MINAPFLAAYATYAYIYAIYANLTPNDAESCAERNQSHILINMT